MSSPSAITKPIVIGLFGLPGSGKTYLKKQLQDDAFGSRFQYFEGSEVIQGIVPGGMPFFKGLAELDKITWREKAIRQISNRCVVQGKIGIVTGHFLFWKEGECAPEPVLTLEDWNTFTHILYLDTPTANIQCQINDDSNRHDRSRSTPEHLKAWQTAERKGLEKCCLKHGVAFRTIKAETSAFQQTLECLNQITLEAKLDALMKVQSPTELRTVLLLDGDKTLIPGDTGEEFWNIYDQSNPLEAIFQQGYSYSTFREAMDLYQTIDESKLDRVVNDVARRAMMHPDVVDLLQKTKAHGHIRVFVVTCGSKRIWEKVLEAAGVSEVEVIGAEMNGITIIPELKGVLVDRLHNVHKQFVWAFGDSPVDLPMLCKADRAVIVVGEKSSRSRSMEDKLGAAVQEGLQASQLLMQDKKDALLLDTTQLSLFDLHDNHSIEAILSPPRRFQYRAATDKSSTKLLMSATRDAGCSGTTLVDAHRLMGRYLATEYLGQVLGLESYNMKHVQGGETEGHRLFHEDNTVIVPLMRGGEPMARGVWEAFPAAVYVHAKTPIDLNKQSHITGRAAIVLVDGVVNPGKSIAEFVTHLRTCDSKVRIVVIAGVVQEQAVEEGGIVDRLSNRYEGLSLIALRVSENKYTGRGSTDIACSTSPTWSEKGVHLPGRGVLARQRCGISQAVGSA